MSSAERVPYDEQRTNIAVLIDMRRNALRIAWSCPVGPARNQQRQIALSLRALLRNPKWLAAHTTPALS